MKMILYSPKLIPHILLNGEDPGSYAMREGIHMAYWDRNGSKSTPESYSILAAAYMAAILRDDEVDDFHHSLANQYLLTGGPVDLDELKSTRTLIRQQMIKNGEKFSTWAAVMKGLALGIAAIADDSFSRQKYASVFSSFSMGAFLSGYMSSRTEKQIMRAAGATMKPVASQFTSDRDSKFESAIPQGKDINQFSRPISTDGTCVMPTSDEVGDDCDAQANTSAISQLCAAHIEMDLSCVDLEPSDDIHVHTADITKPEIDPAHDQDPKPTCDAAPLAPAAAAVDFELTTNELVDLWVANKGSRSSHERSRQRTAAKLVISALGLTDGLASQVADVGQEAGQLLDQALLKSPLKAAGEKVRIRNIKGFIAYMTKVGIETPLRDWRLDDK